MLSARILSARREGATTINRRFAAHDDRDAAAASNRSQLAVKAQSRRLRSYHHHPRATRFTIRKRGERRVHDDSGGDAT